jgi:K+-transporting ATPase ATPase B chain
VAVWLWLTVLFANFAEAIAEGRGKAQAETLRSMRRHVVAKRLKRGSSTEYDLVEAGALRRGDLVSRRDQ